MLVPEEILGAKFWKVKSDTLSSDGLPYALNVLFITFFWFSSTNLRTFSQKYFHALTTEYFSARFILSHLPVTVCFIVNLSVL